MAVPIRPEDLPPVPALGATDALIVDTGAGVFKTTPEEIAEAAGADIGLRTDLADATGAELVNTDLGGTLAEVLDGTVVVPTLLVGNGEFRQVGNETILNQMSPSRRGELLLNPNDDPTPDASAGGELTVLGYDYRMPGREFGTGSNVVAAFYMDRLAGVVQSVRVRMINTGTEPAVPIRFDPTGGENTFELGTNAQGGRVWARNLIQIGGTISNPDTASSYDPVLRLGPGPGPTVDLDDSNSGSSVKWRWRNLNGVLAAINVNAGTIPFQITASTQTVTITNLTVSGTVTFGALVATNLTATTTNTSTRAGDFRNTNSAFTGAVLFAAHSNTTLTTGYFFQGYDLNAATMRAQCLDNGAWQNVTNSYGAISDKRVKTNITAAGSQWDDVKALGGCLKKYNLKSDPDGPVQLGAIAQEWEKISPGLIYEFEESAMVDDELQPTGRRLKGINYSIAYVKALGALSEAMARIEALEARK